MPEINLVWIAIVGSVFVAVVLGFFIIIIIANQRKFISSQKKRLEESRRLQEILRQIPKQIIHAQEKERRRVANDLHDGIVQMLGSVNYNLHIIQSVLDKEKSQSAESVSRMYQDVAKTIDEVKRISHNLRPKVFDDLGFEPAVGSLCDDFQRRTGIPAAYDLNNVNEFLTPELEIGMFRIIQESLVNIEKHANASTVRISSKMIGSSCYLEIVDDGKGFDPHSVSQALPKTNSGLGLDSMKDRAILMGGNLEVESSSAGGTKIIVWIPVLHEND